MYLSRLIVNPRSRQVRHDLADCQELHRTLLSVWPQMSGRLGARAQCCLLYRVEAEPRTGAVTILVQSREAPDWSRLPDGYLLDHQTKPVEATYDGLRPGMRVRFRLRANPTKKIDSKSGPEGVRRNGKRVDLRGEDLQVAWLKRKGEQQCGFRLTHAQARDDVPNVRSQPEDRALGRRGDRRLTFGSVLFEGELEVLDDVAFRQSLENGIGSGKAYGFGLLSIASARA